MTTLSLAFSFWPCCPERGLLAPDEEYLPQSRIVPCRSKIKLAELLPSSRSCFAPSRSTLATPGAQRPPVILIPVRYPGQGARGGGAGHCPRVLKRYYEPVINRASIIPRVSRAVQRNPPHLDREPPEPVPELRQHRPALAIDRYVICATRGQGTFGRAAARGARGPRPSPDAAPQGGRRAERQPPAKGPMRAICFPGRRTRNAVCSRVVLCNRWVCSARQPGDVAYLQGAVCLGRSGFGLDFCRAHQSPCGLRGRSALVPCPARGGGIASRLAGGRRSSRRRIG